MTQRFSRKRSPNILNPCYRCFQSQNKKKQEDITHWTFATDL